LSAIVGVSNLGRARLDGKLEIADQEVLNADQMLEQLLNCSPQLQVAWAEVRRDQIAVERERVEPIPNVLVRAETGYNFESNNTVAGVTAGIRLPIFDRNQGSIMQARSELTRAQAEVGRIELMLRRKFGERFSQYQADLVMARSFEREMLPRAKEAYELYLDSYQKRRAAWPQVLVAQREYFQLADEYLETLVELRRAEADITGLFLGDGLDQPPAPVPQGHREATPRPR
jgi:cobalt-zinc-cadmium efflux system outer membrane protein